MCGIVGAVAQRDVVDILVEGLRRLEYRGYDSAGVAVIHDGQLQRTRRLGKVQELAAALEAAPLQGGTGIAHTRWATHGEPSEGNAHPHISGTLAVVHNGIIENHDVLREKLKGLGYEFVSQTDTEVIVHLVHHYRKTAPSLLVALQQAVKELRGAYGTVLVDSTDPERMVVARSGSPLVIGRGIGENFVASDQMALLPVTRRFQFLEEGDVAEVTRRDVRIFDVNGQLVQRAEQESELSHDAGDKGEYRHYMLKEIYEQPAALVNTLEGRLSGDHLVPEAFGNGARDIFSRVEHVQIVACGTSYHSGMVARYWFEELAGVTCNVEIASEYRYRKSVT
ncbi:MAG: glutamine--fructose-6-phosphate transaminase (isomerizing), partial [Aeromonadaceae bacterium]